VRIALSLQGESLSVLDGNTQNKHVKYLDFIRKSGAAGLRGVDLAGAPVVARQQVKDGGGGGG